MIIRRILPVITWLFIILIGCTEMSDVPTDPQTRHNSLFDLRANAMGSCTIYPLGDYSVGLHYMAIDSSGNYAYATNSLKGMEVIDISDPTEPCIVNEVGDLGETNMMVVSRDYAYLVDFRGALRILDIHDPPNAFLTGSYETSYFAPNWYAFCVAVENNMAYLGCGKGLMAINVSNPAAPVLAGVYDDFPDHCNNVIVRDDIAFATYDHMNANPGDHHTGLLILNVSDPTDIRLLSRFENGIKFWSIALAEEYAFIAQDYYGILYLDISDPTAPRAIASYHQMSAYFHRVYCDDNYLYASTWFSSGLYIFTNDSPLRLVDYYCSVDGGWYKSVMPWRAEGANDWLNVAPRTIVVGNVLGGVEVLRFE